MSIRGGAATSLVWTVILLLVTGDAGASNPTGDATGAGLLGVMPEPISTSAFAGAANSSYSFAVPPGRSGMQPNLSIAYSSGGGQGLLGRGWGLSLPHIQRSTRFGQPTFTFADTFAINWNGRLLDLRQEPDSGTCVQEYRTQIETFMRIKRHSCSTENTYWEVEDGSGRTYQFGGDGGTGHWEQVGDFFWALNRVQDAHGNFMTVNWLTDSNVMYPREIWYAGNNTSVPTQAPTGTQAPTNKVEFAYEGRNDILVNWLGVKSEMRYRLRRVRSWAGSQIASVYLFDYTSGTTGEHPIDLCAGTVCAQTSTTCIGGTVATCSNTCSPGTGFCSSCVPDCCAGRNCGETIISCQGGGTASCPNSCDPADGACIQCSPTCPPPGGGCGNPPCEPEPTGVSTAGVTYSDVDEPSLLRAITRWAPDGKSSLPSTLFTYLEDTQRAWGPVENDVPERFMYKVCKADGRDVTDLGVQFADLNRDALPDLVMAKDGVSRVYLNTGGRWSQPDPSWELPPHAYFVRGQSDNGLRMLDVNGDGLDDLVLKNGFKVLGDPDVWLNNGHGWDPAPSWTVPTDFVAFTASDESEDLGVRFGDVNGDGLVDIVKRRDFSNGGIEKGVWLNTGSGWVEKSGWEVPSFFLIKQLGGGQVDAGLRLLDVNGDGMADLVKSVMMDNVVQPPSVWLSNGGPTSGGVVWELATGWDVPEVFTIVENATDSTTGNEDSDDNGVRFADVNGDGRVDIVVGNNYRPCDGCSNVQTRVYLHRGGKGWVEDPGWSSAVPWAFVEHVFGGEDYDEGVRLADVDGNGTVDFVHSADSCGSSPRDRRANLDGFSELMSGSTNGIGGSVSLTYRPSSAYDNHFDGATADDPSNLGFVLPVVETLTESDGQSGTGHTFTTSFSYRGGFYHYNETVFDRLGEMSFIRGRREFRGFRYVRTNIPGGRAYTEQLFVQDTPLDFAPLVGSVERQALRCASTNVADCPGVGAVFSLDVNTYKRGDTLPPYFHWLQRTDSYLYDWGVNQPIEQLGATDAVKHTASGQDYTFDPNGFVATREVRSFGDAGVTTDDVFARTEFINDSILWRVGLPKRAYVTSQSGGLGERISDSWFYYDGLLVLGQIGTKGDLTQVERWSDLDPADAPGGANRRVVAYDRHPVLGHVTSVTDEEGHQGFLDYGINDPTFTFLDRTRVSVHQITRFYDPRFGAVTQETATGSGTVSSAYDGFGRPTKSWTTLDSPDRPTTCYQYLLGFRPLIVLRFDRETSGSGETCGEIGMLASSSFFDGLGRKIHSKTETAEPGFGSNVVEALTFDAQGRVATASNRFFGIGNVFAYEVPPAGTPATSLVYDAVGRVRSITPPGVPAMTRTYAGWTRTEIDPEGKKTETDRDAYGRIVQRRTYTRPGGVNALYATNTLEYDRWGRLRFVRDTAGNPMEYRYNNFGEVTRIIDPDAGDTERGETVRTYFRDGTLKTVTDPLNRTTTHEYDALHRMTKRIRQNGFEVQYRHDELIGLDGRSSGPDPVGHLTSVLDQETSIQQTFEYDALGRNVRTSELIDGTWYEVSETLDALGRSVVLTYPDAPVRSAVRYEYGNDGRVSAVLNHATNLPIASGVRYAATGGLKHVHYENGIDVDHTYDPNTAWLKTTTAGLSPTNLVANLTFGYTDSGYVNSIQDGTASQTFILDDLYRLETATGSYGSLSYGHDPLGNLTSKAGVVFIFGSSVHPHRATSTSTGLSLAYDAAGNLTSVLDGQNKGRTYEYNEDGNLNHLRDDTGTVKEAWYTYDPFGSRVKRRESEGGEEGTPTIFVSDLYEVSGATHKKYVYLEGRRIAEWREDGSRYFYVSDHLGSLSVVTNGQGQVVQRIEYKPYGEISAMQAPSDSPGFMYAGARKDKMTGLYDFGARFYDPTLARFLSLDPVVSDPLDPRALNPYGYGLGNPISFVDVGGLSAVPVIVGTITGIAVTVATQGCWQCGAAAGGAVSAKLAAEEKGVATTGTTIAISAAVSVGTAYLFSGVPAGGLGGQSVNPAVYARIGQTAVEEAASAGVVALAAGAVPADLYARYAEECQCSLGSLDLPSDSAPLDYSPSLEMSLPPGAIVGPHEHLAVYYPPLASGVTEDVTLDFWLSIGPTRLGLRALTTATSSRVAAGGGARAATNLAEAVGGQKTANLVNAVLKGREPLNALTPAQREAAARFFKDVSSRVGGRHAEAARLFNLERARFLGGASKTPPGTLPDFIKRMDQGGL